MTEIHDEPKEPSTGARDPVERIKSVRDEKLGADAERIDVSVEDDVVILEGSGIAPEALGRVVPASPIWRRRSRMPPTVPGRLSALLRAVSITSNAVTAKCRTTTC